MSQATDLTELRNDILREMYARAEPPLNFDKVLDSPDEMDDDWYQKHYLSSEEEQEIFSKHTEDVSLTKSEHAQLSMACITDLGPTNFKEE
jgi:hypothetical protein